MATAILTVAVWLRVRKEGGKEERREGRKLQSTYWTLTLAVVVASGLQDCVFQTLRGASQVGRERASLESLLEVRERQLVG